MFDFDCTHRGDHVDDVHCDCGAGTSDRLPVHACDLYQYCSPRSLGNDTGWRKSKLVSCRPAACTMCLTGREELIESLRAANPELYRDWKKTE